MHPLADAIPTEPVGPFLIDRDSGTDPEWHSDGSEVTMPIGAEHSGKVAVSRGGLLRSHLAFPVHRFANALLGALGAVATALRATPVGTECPVDTHSRYP